MILFADHVDMVVADAPEDKPPAAAQPEQKRHPPASVRVDGAYAPRRLFSLPVTGADVGLAAGAQPREWLALWGGGRAFVGSTANGLHLFDVRGLFELDFLPLERLRLGFGGGGFFLGVRRAARDETITTWGPLFELTARVDVVRADTYALFVRGAFTVGYDVYDSSAWIGPSIGAGFELDVAGSRASLTSRTDSAAATTSRPP